MAYLYVGIGGVIGSLLRYSFSFLHSSESIMPYGTLLVNLIGSFILGWFAATLAKWPRIPKQLATGFTTGVIGSFTTFSAFCLDAINKIEAGHYLIAFLYVLISMGGGLIFAYAGTLAGSGGKRRMGGEGS
ncbi:fluoride efflux transporter CrcB [Bacillus sp. B-jedd]|uniref:fluoride efflux transporter CrcB n=1 Tax=Bacillus sp. B-jedd TaxID=1476857 RepID=UPI0005156FAE|nr:fluoride efflux transporter CrcB [Bacillus sp. B-jedd]CEG27491.1 crcB protein [Bacillus sp. B-jedd]